MAEIRYIFAYYNHLNPEQLTQDHIASYINYIKKEHGVGRDKCRMTAQSCSFFFKHILPSPYVVPHALYPRREFRLPNILTQEQISHVIQSVTNIKHKAIIALFYGTGIRLSELRFLEMKHISRAEMQLKVVAGKGSRDRFTILPSAILPLLEAYYKSHRPKVFLFEGQTPGKAMNDRSPERIGAGYSACHPHGDESGRVGAACVFRTFHQAFICHPPARCRYGHPYHQAASRTFQDRDHHDLSPPYQAAQG